MATSGRRERAKRKREGRALGVKGQKSGRPGNGCVGVGKVFRAKMPRTLGRARLGFWSVSEEGDKMKERKDKFSQ